MMESRSRLRARAPWLVAGFIGLILIATAWWASALAFLVLCVLAVLAPLPWLGPRVLTRVGWKALPFVGPLAGIKASGVLVAAAAAVLVTGATLAPSPSQGRTSQGVVSAGTGETAARGTSSPAAEAATAFETSTPPSIPSSTAAAASTASSAATTTASATINSSASVKPTQAVSTQSPTAVPSTARPQTSAPASAAPVAGASMVITKVNYDGAVKTTEADEYVEITNRGTIGQNMAGWKIVSVVGGQTFAFPAITIAAAQICRVYTNEMHPESCGLNWGSRNAIWNNDGDRANLVVPNGQVVSTVGY